MQIFVRGLLTPNKESQIERCKFVKSWNKFYKLCGKKRFTRYEIALKNHKEIKFGGK